MTLPNAMIWPKVTIPEWSSPMKTFSALTLAGLMLATMNTGASAWYCRANGYGGSGWARSDSRERAVYLSLYQCSKRGSGCRVNACMP